MEDEKTYEAKFDNLMRALNRDSPAYVPTMAYPGPGNLCYANMTIPDALKDVESYVNGMNKVYGDMWTDCYIDNAITVTPKMAEAFGDDAQFRVGPDGVTIEHYQKSPMQADEYDQLVADPDRFVSDVLVPRKLPWMLSGDKERALKAIETYLSERGRVFGELAGPLSEDAKERYGIVVLVQSFETPALDTLFDSFRGFRGTLTDIRRQPEKVKAAVDALWAVGGGATIDDIPEAPFPFTEEMPHMPAYLSPKQFDELYWPNQKAIIEKWAKAGSKVFILLEGNWPRPMIEHFREVAKDSVVLQADDNDIFELYDWIGDWQVVAGGCKLAKTRLEPREASIEYAKRVIDHCAPGGGFLFTCDKNWISPGDVNANLIDTFNLAHEYGRY